MMDIRGEKFRQQLDLSTRSAAPTVKCAVRHREQTDPTLSANQTKEPQKQRSTKHRVALLCGYLFFVVGLIGVFLPVLPTTIFWIIAAIFFARSSPAMYQRILTWPRIGHAVKHFVSDGVITRRSKIIAVFGMGVAAIIVALAPLGDVPTIASLAGIAVGACYVLTRPSESTGDAQR